MNWYSIFYWLTVADGVKSAFDVFSNIFTWFTIVALIIYIIATIYGHSGECNDKDVNKHWRKHLGWIMSLCMFLTTVTWVGYMAIPTKKDALLIVAGGSTMNFLTTDSAAKEIPHEVMNYLVTELKSMSEEAKVDIGIKEQTNKIIEEAKGMTGAQLIERMKSDSTFSAIITGR